MTTSSGAVGGRVMLAAFEGWNDAGSAASQALAHLHEVWGGDLVTELDPEEYHDFQVSRPTVSLDDDGRRVITWPTTSVYAAERPGREDLVALVHGIEPSMRWRRYCGELLDAAERLGVTTVITLGALLADVPHTRPIPVSATSDDPGLRAELGLDMSTYEGPTGIAGVLQAEATRRGLRGLSVWAAVPHYVAHPPSPKATIALLVRLEELLGVSIPLVDAEIAEYVAQLEEAKDTAELPEASGEAIAREFERYLRRRESGGTGENA
jgi:proteasome assembly chaperone (PAC2) family protein